MQRACCRLLSGTSLHLQFQPDAASSYRNSEYPRPAWVGQRLRHGLRGEYGQTVREFLRLLLSAALPRSSSRWLRSANQAVLLPAPDRRSRRNYPQHRVHLVFLAVPVPAPDKRHHRAQAPSTGLVGRCAPGHLLRYRSGLHTAVRCWRQWGCGSTTGAYCRGVLCGLFPRWMLLRFPAKAAQSQ